MEKEPNFYLAVVIGRNRRVYARVYKTPRRIKDMVEHYRQLENEKAMNEGFCVTGMEDISANDHVRIFRAQYGTEPTERMQERYDRIMSVLKKYGVGIEGIENIDRDRYWYLKTVECGSSPNVIQCIRELAYTEEHDAWVFDAQPGADPRIDPYARLDLYQFLTIGDEFTPEKFRIYFLFPK